jgi:hypothetical protein
MNEPDLLTQFHTDIAEPSAEAWQRARAATATARAPTPPHAGARAASATPRGTHRVAR